MTARSVVDRPLEVHRVHVAEPDPEVHHGTVRTLRAAAPRQRSTDGPLQQRTSEQARSDPLPFEQPPYGRPAVTRQA